LGYFYIYLQHILGRTKSSTPSPPKMGMFAEKSQKITIFQL